MGYRVGALCYSTNAEAADVFYSSQPVAIWTAQTASTYFRGTHFYNEISSTWDYLLERCTYSTGSGTAPTCAITTKGAYTITFPSCTLDPVISGLPAGFDYTILGALFAFSFSVVAALYFIGKSGGAIVNIFRPR